jgi:CheY-like chemotaxis protein
VATGTRGFGPQVVPEQRYQAAPASQGVAERFDEKTLAGLDRAADYRVVHEAAIQAVQRAAENRIQRGVLLRSYLEHDGLTVITTGSGAEAIQLARDTAPDLIVLDLRLPDVPGEEVAREVRATAATPIMRLTAKTDTSDRIHGLELGADDYVTKPFSPREIVLRARAILRRAGAIAKARSRRGGEHDPDRAAGERARPSRRCRT